MTDYKNTPDTPSNPQGSEGKKSDRQSARKQRELRLAKALRKNLSRRKQSDVKTPE